MRLREILQISNPHFADLLRDGVDAIETVHRLTDLAAIPVVQSRRRTEQGAFVFQSRPNRPIRIEISKYATFPALTLLHEVGHLLDAVVLNPLRDGFATDVNPDFEPFLLQLSGTSVVREIGRLASNRSVRASTLERSHCRHYLRSPELWARAYCQWIVMRSANVELRLQLDTVRTAGVFFAGHRFAHLWEENEFNDIMPLVDDLLDRSGLI